MRIKRGPIIISINSRKNRQLYMYINKLYYNTYLNKILLYYHDK